MVRQIGGGHMTDQELAQAFDANLTELHRKVDALPPGLVKRRSTRLASIMHRAAEELRDLALEDGMIQPFSGGTPKPPGP